ncbi:putative variant sh3 domain-containing protein [Golovinomyces cichoracearum]|uniref:Putative variant sh3 domain-containing protein n=1 Tax=Golovinomyces cichoracearum TaxID=62708 RepID=A0A420J3V4_9PEZI|nr:putative variant sh3 domain-containing protein [Golovinomyces cichoracearum]
MLEPTKLPSRFPCWVRAKFSYGGESKHDLGFMEGDLIECLNAGDGSWWMGRLWRDKRVKGLFPSNFVEVLDANFRPAVRSTSPMPNRSPSTSPFNPQPPRNTKSKLYRKPYQSYSAPAPPIKKPVDSPKQISTPPRARSPAPLLRNTQPRVQSQVRRFESNTKPSSSPLHYGYKYDGIHSPSRVQNNYNPGLQITGVFSPQPSIHSNFNSRVPSPLPIHNKTSTHLASQQPEVNCNYYYRTPSPHPPVQYEYDDRHQPIPMDPQLNSTSSSPPPAPPPHRIIYTPNVMENVQNSPEEYEAKPRAPTPTPPSSRGTGMTPSPLRSAMDDVMSSLADMGIPHNEPSSEAPLNPWSPEAFDQTYSRAWRNNESRLKNSNRYEVNEKLYKEEKSQPFEEKNQLYQVNKNPPLLSNYVQRMESRLNRLHADNSCSYDEDRGPAVPPKAGSSDRPKSCIIPSEPEKSNLKHRRSAYDVGKSMLGRTYSTKTNITSSSSGTRSTTTNTTTSTQYTNRSLMSGLSAGGLSNTSAGSLERKRAAATFRSHSAFGTRKEIIPSEKNGLRDIKSSRSDTPPSGISYHSSHASEILRSNSQAALNVSSGRTGTNVSSGQTETNVLGGLTAPKPRKSGFFKKMIESAKTGAASARNSIAVGDLIRSNGTAKTPDGVTSISGGLGNNQVNDTSHDKVIETDWVQVRRDVNRSNSLSRIERLDRKERCQMMDYITINPIDELYRQCNGDERVDGNPVTEATDFQLVNFTLVDKNTRMINSLPPMTNPISLATGFICRPYRSDVQRLRAIFTWVSEKIAWEEEFESEIDPRRVIQSKRGCAQEVAILVMEMCTAVGIHAEVVHGYLKTPGEALELNFLPRANHWWNAVLIDGEWRIMDCSLASPSNPYRCLYSSASSQVAESWWFLARPTKICWTHIPERHQQQHLSPQVSPQILLALPCACPPFFKNEITMTDYDTSLVRIEDLELVHIKFTVPADVECVAEVEAKTFTRDTDGDFFETGDVVKKRALAQAEWVGGQKRYTVKALLPGDEGHGALKIYAGKRGLMHSIKDIPHPLAFALPINHTGDNPPYEFFTRYPTPHAQRHDLYVVQPQCQKLALNNTFVFAIRQHPSSHCAGIMNNGSSSTALQPRPGSAFSMSSTSASGSYSSGNFSYTSTKPAKLAIQSPAGKVLRLMRKEERNLGTSQAVGEKGDGGTWETIIKVGEKGMWRGLVLADRTARWCVFAEWSCI